jgi:23S rRNA A1618 N6-methylase RlmF
MFRTLIFQVQKVNEDGKILHGLIELIDADQTNPFCGKPIDFVMCNPPFFTNEQELLGQSAGIRKPEKRHKPNSINTAQIHEAVFTDGGEVGFLKKMVDESFLVSNRIK